MWKPIIFFLFLLISLQGAPIADIFYEEPEPPIVLHTKQIVFPRFPEAFNPSLTKWERGFLLSFRHCPDRSRQHWLSEIWVVLLDEELEPITEPQKLATRVRTSKTPSQAEDARFFTLHGRLFLLYNDNIDEIFFDNGKRRDMFMAEVFFAEERFQLSAPLKLYPEEKYNVSLQQKNWIPFEWQNDLYFIYSITPHEILSPNLKNGVCFSLYKTASSFPWPYGSLRGSSNAQLVDGEYLAFFHSSLNSALPPLATGNSGTTLWAPIPFRPSLPLPSRGFPLNRSCPLNSIPPLTERREWSFLAALSSMGPTSMSPTAKTITKFGLPLWTKPSS